MSRRYHLLNVFVRDALPLSGNPLCVFEDGAGLDTDGMQALARQFNLSETTFLLPSASASRGVRIFTPDFEMPFAGHPTLGSAHIVRLLGETANPLTLEMPAGVIPVRSTGNHWTLQARAARSREVAQTGPVLAAALGLAVHDVLQQPGAARSLWLDSGSEQLLVPLASADAVRRATPRIEDFADIVSSQGRRMAYVFAGDGPDRVIARFFFEADGAFREDPATGSACANLGGWYRATGATGALRRQVLQGDQVRRPATLQLHVNDAGEVSVTGEVVHLGSGSISV